MDVKAPSVIEALTIRADQLASRAEGLEAFARERMEDWFGAEPSPGCDEVAGGPSGKVPQIIHSLQRIEQALLATENWLHKAD